MLFRFLMALAILTAPVLALAQDQWTPIIRRLSGIPVPALDAGIIPYTPTVLTDWDSNADPGDADDALHQLAERIDDAEVAGGVGYTPSDGSAWANPDPTTVAGALDDLALYRQRVRRISVSQGAENANTVPVTITVTNMIDESISQAVRVKVSIYDDEVLDDPAAQAAFTLSDGGDGSLSFSAASASVYLFETSNGGSLVVNVNDIAGASGATKHLLIELLHTTSPAQLVFPGPVKTSVNFDGV